MSTLILLGAVAGDIIGSRFEHNPRHDPHFTLLKQACHFTDDTVMTIAVADALMHRSDYGETIRRYALSYPDAGYGSYFRRWMREGDGQPYNSLGNGSAMRVSPAGWAGSSMDEVLRLAEASAAVTHNHPEGIKGAQAVALGIFLARTGAARDVIRSEIGTRFGYDLTRTLDEIRPTYRWDSTSPGSVPESIIAFLESEDYESAVRNAITLGGDADTMAAIAGSLAEAFYGPLPEDYARFVEEKVPAEFWAVIEEFNRTFR